MVKYEYGVLFEVWTEFLNVIYTSFGLKGLILYLFHIVVLSNDSKLRNLQLNNFKEQGLSLETTSYSAG
jgi:hypothetical protein